MFEHYQWLHPDFNALATRARQAKLHHSLLLHGSKGLGKSSFAKVLAEYLLCSQPDHNMACGKCQSCLLNQAQTHPDLHLIQSDKQIGVDLIRQAIEKLTSKSHISSNRVLVIYAADSMTEAASNALLKTLEEPLPGAYLLLVTAHAHKLLPTILSRCEKIQLSVPTSQQLNQFALSQQLEASEQMLNMYASSPLVLLSQLKQDNEMGYADFEALLASLSAANADISKLAKSWEGHTDKLFHWLQYWLRSQLQLCYQDPLASLFQQTLAVQKVTAQAGINKMAQLIGLFSSFQQCFVHGESNVC